MSLYTHSESGTQHAGSFRTHFKIGGILMNCFSEKIYLTMTPPTEDDAKSDKYRLLQALREAGYDRVSLPLHVLQTLYPMCRDCEYKLTATLVYREEDWVVEALEPGDTRKHHYGLAADYGSTTILLQLLDLNTGKILSEARETNRQRTYGTDILTRIIYTIEKPEHMEELQKATCETFQLLLEKLTKETGIHAKECPVMIISGNTTMMHFLLKLNAWTVFSSPFAPVTAEPGWVWGRELGMDFSGMIYMIPSASNYVGGDIISGLLTMDFWKKEEVSLFFDIGTNGELVIGNKEWLLAGAGAAGPALEGYISRFGMQAGDGAIDSVSIHGKQISYTTINHKKPVGICGSGIIDLLAQMLLNGWINIAGELNPDASPSIIYLEEEEQYAAVYAPAEESGIGQPLYFSQTDIAQYLDTKAAAATMVDCLLESAGFSAEELEHCYLSGAFSAHSDLESAITIGMFPDLPREKYICIPNSSLEGARTLLLDRSRMQDIHELIDRMYCVQFASIPDFLVRMQAAKFVPHTDMSRYPSVAEKLKTKL